MPLLIPYNSASSFSFDLVERTVPCATRRACHASKRFCALQQALFAQAMVPISLKRKSYEEYRFMHLFAAFARTCEP